VVGRTGLVREDAPVMDLAGFLLERIAEDEAAWSLATEVTCEADLAGTSRHMVAECRAKRSVVEQCARADMRLTAVRAEHAQYLVGQYELAVPILRLLSEPYADHADYRDEWRCRID
jgi:hypothetical protein